MPDPELPDPEPIPGYEILAELGGGGWRTGWGGPAGVFKARHADTGRLVALKLLPHSESLSCDTWRLWLEAEVLSRLRHSNVVTLIDHGQYDGRPYLATELLDGGSLAARIGRGRLEPAEAVELVSTLARAVHHAHQFGFVLRNLSPQHVLFTADGRPKLVDFGWVRVPAWGTDERETQPLIAGVPPYMAPEQVAGGKAGPAADVWALGVILYECLTGLRPFRAPTLIEVIEQIVRAAPGPPRASNPHVSRRLSAACLRALAKDPARRHPTAGAFADELARCREV